MNKSVILSSENIRLVILPHIGGRLVSLNHENSTNILSSDSSLWNHEFENTIVEYTSFNILQFRGHSTWVGPQSEWWIHQDINQEKKKNKDTWPPDPFLDYGDFEIISQTQNSIELIGNESEYTGVQIKKSYKILDNGNVELIAKAENIRKEEVSWDLWFNTRLPGNCKSYVPIEFNTNFRIETSPENEELKYSIIDDFFTFDEQTPSKDYNQASSKAFITPSLPYIFSFNEGYLFIIHINIFDPKDVHPEHGMVEVYNAISHNTEDSLLELEYHSPYSSIKPNESIEIEQVWELVKYNGSNTRVGHVAFIQNWLSYK